MSTAIPPYWMIGNEVSLVASDNIFARIRHTDGIDWSYAQRELYLECMRDNNLEPLKEKGITSVKWLKVNSGDGTYDTFGEFPSVLKITVNPNNWTISIPDERNDILVQSVLNYGYYIAVIIHPLNYIIEDFERDYLINQASKCFRNREAYKFFSFKDFQMAIQCSNAVRHLQSVDWKNICTGILKFDLHLTPEQDQMWTISAEVRKVLTLKEYTGYYCVVENDEMIKKEQRLAPGIGGDWYFLENRQEQESSWLAEEDKGILVYLAEELLRNRTCASINYTLPKSGLVNLNCNLVIEQLDTNVNKYYDLLKGFGIAT